MLHRRNFLTFAAAIVLSACASSGQVVLPAGTKLIVLRHADRTAEDLSPTGRARAEALVGALEGTEIDAVYSPKIKRNLDTAAPLAKARGLVVQPLAPENVAPRLMKVGAGKTIVWVGNKGNITAIWEELGLPEPPPVEYGDLYIVDAVPAGSPDITRKRFEP